MGEKTKATESNAVDIEALRNAFKEGATPNEKDYGRLIDLASAGSLALGANALDATGVKKATPGAGLTIESGKLAVKAGKGISVNGEGVAVKVDDKTLSVGEHGLALKLKPGSGLEVADEPGLHIKPGAGLKRDEHGLGVALDPQSGLTTTASGTLAVSVGDPASGLMVDSRSGALKVKVSASGDNYLTVGTEGLAITEKGIEKIHTILTTESKAALEKARHNTDDGEHDDTQSAGEVETAIATALNAAYKKGHGKKHTENQLTVKPVEPLLLHVKATEGKDTTVNIRQHLTAAATLGTPVFYFMPVKGNEADWRALVEANGLSADGHLHLSAREVYHGTVKVLALAVAPTTPPSPGVNIACAEIPVEVTVQPTISAVTIEPSETVQINTLLTAKYQFTPTNDDACTFQWCHKKAGTWLAVPEATQKTWTPGKQYAGASVRVEVTPRSKTLKGLYTQAAQVSKEVTLVNIPRSVSIKHVDVNNHKFSKDAGFPTTGFVGATFTLVLEGAQASGYTWTVSPAAAQSWVKVADGVVRFTAKGTGNEVTIVGMNERENTRVEYKFTLKAWFTNKGSQTMTWTAANNACQNHG